MAEIRSTTGCLVLLTAILAGCENPALQERVERRQEKLRQTVADLSQMEASRAARMEATLDMLEGLHKRQIARNRQNPDEIRKWLDDDERQWEERQPVLKHEIDELLKGDPASIERTWPALVD